jgi:hypothetical protein
MERSKSKLSETQLLQMEKTRLKTIVKEQEEKLRAHLGELREHSFDMALNTILPFGFDTNHKIKSLLTLVNESILPALFGISFGKKHAGTNKNLIRILQGLIITITYRLFSKFFGRKRKSDAET